MEFLSAAWDTVTALAPSLALGLVIAGILHVSVRKERILSHLGRAGFRSSAKAALVGVPLPLCSCGVLPAALGLRRDGASKGAVTSFLISTPQTGVDSIMVTWGMLGWPVAVAKVAAAFLAGLIGGTIADHTGNGEENEGKAIGCTERETGSLPRRIWDYVFGSIFREIYGWLAAGILISAAITIILEPGQLSRYPMLAGPLGLLAALAIGIPLYVCSIASVPIAAGLIYAGFPVGSALVFLMAGPATNAATMGAVRKTLGNRVFIIYILTVVAVSLAAGLILNNLDVSVAGMESHSHTSGGAMEALSTAAGVLMLAGMAWLGIFDLLRRARRRRTSVTSTQGLLLEVSGMSCSGCEARIRSALSALPGVRNVEASADDGTVRIIPESEGEPSRDAIAETVSGLGYVPGRWR